MSGLNQLERDFISARTKEELASAKARGRECGTPNKRNKKADVVQMLYNEGYKISEIVNKTDLSRSGVYRILNDIKVNDI